MENRVLLILGLCLVMFGMANACLSVTESNQVYNIRPGECYTINSALTNVTINGQWGNLNVDKTLASGENYSNTDVNVKIQCSNITKVNNLTILKSGECRSVDYLNWTVCSVSSDIENQTRLILDSMNYTRLCSSVNLQCADCNVAIANLSQAKTDCDNNLTSIKALYSDLSYRCNAWLTQGTPESVRSNAQESANDIILGISIIAGFAIAFVFYWYAIKKPEVHHKVGGDK